MGRTPLMYLIRFMHHGMEYDMRTSVLALLMRGADVNAKDNKGWTPLHYCAVDRMHTDDLASLLPTFETAAMKLMLEFIVRQRTGSGQCQAFF